MLLAASIPDARHFDSRRWPNSDDINAMNPHGNLSMYLDNVYAISNGNPTVLDADFATTDDNSIAGHGGSCVVGDDSNVYYSRYDSSMPDHNSAMANDDSTLVDGDFTAVDEGFNLCHDSYMPNDGSNIHPNNYITGYLDDDSTFGDAPRSASTSIRSYITSHEWKHDRRYHAYQSGAYPFPNDEREQDRLDMLHCAITRLLGNKLFLAPIPSNIKKVLDIGTGTGLWVIQMGDLYSAADITGTDLSPIQPTWVPPNVNFLIDDAELDWVESNTYDYIHCRCLSASIKNWPQLIRQIYGALKPGGWVEFQEFSTTYTSNGDPLQETHPGYAFLQLNHALDKACSKTERMLGPTPELTKWASEAGFDTIGKNVFKMPIGNWPTDQCGKEIGTMMRVNLSDGVAGMTAVLLRDVLGWEEVNVELLNAAVRCATKESPNVMVDYVVVLAKRHI